MNELKPDAKIISKFKGEINGHAVDNEQVYYSIIDVLDAMSNKDFTFTKPHEFISDLITTFTELDRRYDNDRYTYLEINIIDIIDEATTLEELTNNLADFIGNEYCPQLYIIYDNLKDSYYTS